jgi:hypothetical protein
MKMNLRVTDNNGTVEEVECNIRDFVAFESHWNRSIARLEEEMKITDLVWLAWHSISRRKLTKDDFENWLDTIDGVEASEESPK